MKILLAAALLAMAPAAPAEQDLIGVYRLSQVEMGGGLELTPDHRFRYELDYGAVSEAAEGRWAVRNDGVHLDSEPMSQRVLAEMERSDAAFSNQLLRIEGDTLVMDRYETRMTFRPVKQ
jgi:hypothetical protein